MQTYDHTLSLNTITAILRGLAASPDINTAGTRDHTRAIALLHEKQRRDKRRKQSTISTQ